MNVFSNVKVEVRDISGMLIDTTEHHNIICEDGLNWLARSMFSAGYSPKIIYLAWGTDLTAESSTQIKLVTEVGRKVVTSTLFSSTTAFTCQTITYLAPTDAICAIGELGWFMGSSADATADTGCLYARSTYTRTKTALESLTIIRTDIFTT